jgi:hypothetical protein
MSSDFAQINNMFKANGQAFGVRDDFRNQEAERK